MWRKVKIKLQTGVRYCMKILTFGLDNSIINDKSDLARRVLDYAALVEKYVVIVPATADKETSLSDKAKVWAVGGCCKIVKLFRIYWLAENILRQEKFDVISVQDVYYLALAALILARKNRIGLEVQVHGLEKFFGFRKFLAGFILRRADAIRTVSQRKKKQLLLDFHAAADKITVAPIYSAINNKQLTINNKRSDDNFIFLTVGRLAPVKNIGLQIEAMAEIAKRYPSTELWIAGEGAEYKNLKFKIANLKLDGCVKLLGQKFREELAEIHKMADAFLLTSNSEGWGLAVIEAAGYGLPIIMTDVGCAGEVIKNNDSGIIIPVGDRASLVGAMEKIMRDNNFRSRLGEGARRAVEKLPSKQETLNLYLASWQKTADSQGKRL